MLVPNLCAGGAQVAAGGGADAQLAWLVRFCKGFLGAWKVAGALNVFHVGWWPSKGSRFNFC